MTVRVNRHKRTLYVYWHKRDWYRVWFLSAIALGVGVGYALPV